MSLAMLELDTQQQAARDWFESLRDRICSAFEELERDCGSDARFTYTAWDRADPSGGTGGGGVRGQMTGDRKSTRLNSSHANISYAVFCLKKKNNKSRRYEFVLLN